MLTQDVLMNRDDLTNFAQLTLHAPIDFSPTGVQNYLQSVFNNRRYIQVLPHDFSHFLQFLKNGNAVQPTRAYIKTVLKLFTNKYKGVAYINAHAFSDMLEKLPELLNGYFLIKRSHLLDQNKNAVNNILYTSFVSQYDAFKRSPLEFLDTLSQEIVETLHNDLPLFDDDISIEDLRQAVATFLEITMNKLIWHPEDHATIWNCVKTISQQLHTLMQHSIIDNTDDGNQLDDVYWTLIHRFCLFIEIASKDLPISFYEQIKNDITTQQLVLLSVEEQDSLIQDKGSFLMDTVLEHSALKQAQDRGILVR